MITACIKTVGEGKQGHAYCRILLLQQSLFLVSVEFHGNHMTVTKMSENLANLTFGILLELK